MYYCCDEPILCISYLTRIPSSLDRSIYLPVLSAHHFSALLFLVLSLTIIQSDYFHPPASLAAAAAAANVLKTSDVHGPPSACPQRLPMTSSTETEIPTRSADRLSRDRTRYTAIDRQGPGLLGLDRRDLGWAGPVWTGGGGPGSNGGQVRDGPFSERTSRVRE